MQLMFSAYEIRKRPVQRPAIPSPYTNSSSPKVVYINAKTRFMSAVNRTRKLLNLIAKRDQSLHGPTDDEILAAGRVGNAKSAAFRAARRKSRARKGGSYSGEQVYLKATGKAIHHLLQIALWFQKRPEYRIRITTGSSGVIDDIVRRVDGEDGERQGEKGEGGKNNDDMETKEPEVPETRIRMLSMVTVAIGWK
jgi:ribonuclease P/MRP protein subunit POP7